MTKILITTIVAFLLSMSIVYSAEVTNTDNNTFTGNNTFTKDIELKKDTTSPNIKMYECDTDVSGCRDTYPSIQWIDRDTGNTSAFITAHRRKGSVTPPDVHDHFIIRFACGNDESDITNCGRIQCQVFKDVPVCEFRNIDIYLNNTGNNNNNGRIFFKSPDGNKWSLGVDNNGNTVWTDENP